MDKRVVLLNYKHPDPIQNVPEPPFNATVPMSLIQEYIKCDKIKDLGDLKKTMKLNSRAGLKAIFKERHRDRMKCHSMYKAVRNINKKFPKWMVLTGLKKSFTFKQCRLAVPDDGWIQFKFKCKYPHCGAWIINESGSDTILTLKKQHKGGHTLCCTVWISCNDINEQLEELAKRARTGSVTDLDQFLVPVNVTFFRACRHMADISMSFCTICSLSSSSMSIV